VPMQPPSLSSPQTEDRPPPQTLVQIFWRFLKFGMLAFGGPVAQIAMIRKELVDDQRWISSAHFNRILAVMQALPGPEAHELCVHLGMRAKGRLGGLLAGLAFMLPGLVLMLGLSWAYFQINMKGAVTASAFLGIQIAMVAVLLRAVHRIGEHVLTDRGLWIIGALSAIGALTSVPFWLTLPVCGAAYALWKSGKKLIAGGGLILGLGLAWAWSAGHFNTADFSGVVRTGSKADLPQLFISGLRAGFLTFGGAYTAIPFIRNDAVGHGWMSDGQFLDGLALSGVLPAPLIIFATFVGYVGGGLNGALAMTAGVFLPAFAFSMIFYERLEAIMDHPGLQALLAGIAAAVVGQIAVTALHLARTVAGDVPNVALALVVFVPALAVAYRWKSKINVLVIVLVSAMAGIGLFGM
jgi:chromate transporter